MLCNRHQVGDRLPFGLVHLVHIGGKRGRTSAHSNAGAIVVEVRVAAAGLVVAAEVTRRIARKINLRDKNQIPKGISRLFLPMQWQCCASPTSTFTSSPSSRTAVSTTEEPGSAAPLTWPRFTGLFLEGVYGLVFAVMHVLQGCAEGLTEDRYRFPVSIFVDEKNGEPEIGV